MMISATLLDRTGEVRPYALFHPDVELGFDILNRFVKEGDTLLTVAILDDGKWTSLSVESFDGKPCLEAIKRMADDWQQILSCSIISQYRIDTLAVRRIERHRVCIRQLELAIVSAERRLKRTEQTIGHEPQRRKILEPLENVLNRYEKSLSTEQASLQRFLNQLPDRITDFIRSTTGG